MILKNYSAGYLKNSFLFLPAFGNKSLLGDVEAEHVKAVIDGLDLSDLRVPGL